MNYIDLFHGIGGFALGAYWAGMSFSNHLCSDIEKYPQKLYRQRFPESHQLGDITKIDWHKLKKEYPGDWIMSGGFPCQDISVAGKGKGLIDENGNKTRSGLWYEYQRGISILRPRFAIMENVGALLTRGMSSVIGSLSEVGYNAEWGSISAASVGAWHKRERIWIIAYPDNNGPHEPKNRQSDNQRNDRGEARTQSIKQFKGCDISGESGNANVSNSNNERLEGRQDTRGVKESGKKRKQQPKRQSKSHGGNYWSTEPSVGRLAHGVPNRVDRLKGLGNAIVPQIAEMLFRKIGDKV